MTADSPETAAEDTPVERLSFEDALAELERVVSELEDGKVPLEASIELYQRGAALKGRCEALLRDAELKVSRIVAGEGGEVALAEEPAPAAAEPSRERARPAAEDDIPF